MKTIKMLKEWCDIFIDMRKYIPSDIYGNPNHHELQARVREIWKDI